jgi:hypothetical protein
MSAAVPGRLADGEEAAIRRAVAEAVIGIPDNLRAGLESNPGDYLRLVVASRTAAEETSRLLRDSITGARAAGHSWDTLGKVLGVSRQAAQQRFGIPGAPAAASDGGDSGTNGAADAPTVPERRVISPLTAFDEMAVLAEEGRRGWHSVGYGTLFHLVERSSTQWEHRRLGWSPLGHGAKLEADGWMLVGTATFPWAYYARPLDLPAQ